MSKKKLQMEICHICEFTIGICLRCHELKINSATNDVLICSDCFDRKGFRGRAANCAKCRVSLLSCDAFDNAYFNELRHIRN